MLLLSIEHAQTIRTSKAQKNLRTVGCGNDDDFFVNQVKRKGERFVLRLRVTTLKTPLQHQHQLLTNHVVHMQSVPRHTVQKQPRVL